MSEKEKEMREMVETLRKPKIRNPGGKPPEYKRGAEGGREHSARAVRDRGPAVILSFFSP